MSPAKIVRILAVVLVIAFALIPAIPFGPIVLAITGLVLGGFVATENRTILFLMAIALSSGVTHTLNVIPVLGGWLTALLSNLETVLAAATITVITLVVKERLTE